ncbi:hypothetical protein L1S32_01965 [Methanogenium sp. S4BF]|uniref:hypothetical protein n=1 Tax=Methanogenium sp. S4BF TaxID=1789226 RepID=UPI002417A609|nr:hypothetical protein [Methanogenium sp. S4BF]WFN34908.1 hypothetical protein L1S32_01965 [Methanogenium sp. S4BF]
MTDYFELAELADRILTICDDDVEELVSVLDELEEGVRDELLVSDFLNAYQVFWYFFRYEPDILAAERLMLSSASSLLQGVLIEERDIYEILFRVADGRPEMFVTDGEEVLMVFQGTNAYRDAAEWVDNT